MKFRVDLCNEDKKVMSSLDVEAESIDKIRSGDFVIEMIRKNDRVTNTVNMHGSAYTRQSINLLKLIIDAYFMKDDRTVRNTDYAEYRANDGTYSAITNAWKDLRNYIQRKCIDHNYPGSEYPVTDETYFRAFHIDIIEVEKYTYLDVTAVTDGDSKRPNPILEYLLSQSNKVLKDEGRQIIEIKNLIDLVEVYRQTRDDKSEVINTLIRLKSIIDNLPKKAESRFADSYYRYRKITMSLYIANSLNNRLLTGMYHNAFANFNDNAFTWFYTARNLMKDFAINVLKLGAIEETYIDKEKYVFTEPADLKDEEMTLNTLCKARAYTDLAMVAWGCENMKDYAKDEMLASSEDFIQEALNYICTSLPYAKSDITYYDNVLRDYGVILEHYTHDYQRGHTFAGSRNMFIQIEKIYELSKQMNQQIRLNPNHKNYKVLLSLYDKRINELLNEGAFGLAADEYIKVYYSRKDQNLTYDNFKELWTRGLNDKNHQEISDLNEKIRMIMEEMRQLFIDDPRMVARYTAVYYRNSKMLNGSLDKREKKLLKEALNEHRRIKPDSSVATMLEITSNAANDLAY